MGVFLIKLEDLEKSRKNAKQMVIINIVVGLLGTFIYKTWLGVGIIIASALFFLFMVNPRVNRYKQLFKENIVKASLEGIFTELEYHNEKGISLEEVKCSEIIELQDEFVSNDLIVAKYGSVHFKQSDVIVSKSKKQMSDSGNTTEHSSIGFMGRVIIFDYLRATEASVRVLGKQYKAAGDHQGMIKKLMNKVEKTFTDEKIFMESEAFNQSFDTYCKDSKSAFYVLTPSVIEAITMLSDRYKGEIALAFKNEKLYVAINSKQDSLEPKLLSARTVWDERKQAIKDIEVVTNFIELMRLEENILVASAN